MFFEPRIRLFPSCFDTFLLCSGRQDVAGLTLSCCLVCFCAEAIISRCLATPLELSGLVGWYVYIYVAYTVYGEKKILLSLWKKEKKKKGFSMAVVEVNW